MVLAIPDEIARKAAQSDPEALIDLACRLCDAEWPNHYQAARLAGLERMEFDDALKQRRIPLHRPTVKDVEQDVAALERLER